MRLSWLARPFFFGGLFFLLYLCRTIKSKVGQAVARPFGLAIDYLYFMVIQAFLSYLLTLQSS